MCLVIGAGLVLLNCGRSSAVKTVPAVPAGPMTGMVDVVGTALAILQANPTFAKLGADIGDVKPYPLFIEDVERGVTLEITLRSPLTSSGPFLASDFEAMVAALAPTQAGKITTDQELQSAVGNRIPAENLIIGEYLEPQPMTFDMMTASIDVAGNRVIALSPFVSPPTPPLSDVRTVDKFPGPLRTR